MGGFTFGLVLGGGGVTGVAWETGVLKGLRDAGVDVGDADLVVGTSAGSIVGAQLTTGVDLDRLFEGQIDPAAPAPPRADASRLFAFLGSVAMETGLTREQLTARTAALALEAEYPDTAARIESILARLPIREWPDRRLLITAVDAGDGTLATWDRSSGVPLPIAVASSCAVPGVYPAVEINGHRYVDGGMRSATNADLAGGQDLVLVIAPTGARPPGADLMAALPPDSALVQWANALDVEVAGLRAAGADVHVIVPDEAALDAIGTDVFDPARRSPAARAGRAQAAKAAELLAPALRARL
jgi:NTE family protein